MSPDYTIARDGLTYGPYTESELRAHLVSGHILPTDLARTPTMQEWLALPQVFPAAFPPTLTRATFPDPPNLPWWILLLLAIFTLNLFAVIWDLNEAVWLTRVTRRSVALWLYAALAVIFVLKLPQTAHNILYNLGYALPADNPDATLFTVLTLTLGIAARLLFRRQLLRHFNRPEPIGLALSWLMSLLFGGIYFQYHFNRINETKRLLAELPTAS